MQYNQVECQKCKSTGEKEIIRHIKSDYSRRSYFSRFGAYHYCIKCYEGIEDALDRGNYGGLKLTAQVLKIAQGVTRNR